MNRDDLTFIFNSILRDTKYAKLKTCSCFLEMGALDSGDVSNSNRESF